MLNFGKTPGGGTYPRKSYEANEDQSFGFTDPRMVQSGQLRGQQKVGYGSVSLDGANNRITVGANEATLALGDLSNDDDTFGFAVSDEAGDMRLLAGQFDDGSIKIKLSQATYDVRTASDDQLIWSSDFNMLKVVEIITKTQNVSNAGVIGGTYPHGLSFIPSFLSYTWSNDPTDAGKTYFSSGAAPFGGSSYGVTTSVDATNVYVAWIGGSATTYQANIKVYLFRETAQ